MTSSTNDDDGVSCLCGDAINYKGNQRNKTLWAAAMFLLYFVCSNVESIICIINRNHSKNKTARSLLVA